MCSNCTVHLILFLNLYTATPPLCQLSPSVLTISEGSSGVLSCTTFNNPHYRDETAQFILSRSGIILGRRYSDLNSFDVIVNIYVDQEHGNYTYRLNISWTSDIYIRIELDTIQCVIFYRSLDHAVHHICETTNVSIIFQDQHPGMQLSYATLLPFTAGVDWGGGVHEVTSNPNFTESCPFVHNTIGDSLPRRSPPYIRIV